MQCRRLRVPDRTDDVRGAVRGLEHQFDPLRLVYARLWDRIRLQRWGVHVRQHGLLGCVRRSCDQHPELRHVRARLWHRLLVQRRNVFVRGAERCLWRRVRQHQLRPVELRRLRDRLWDRVDLRLGPLRLNASIERDASA